VLLSLVDSLRCPAGHEETSLVLSVEAWSGQRVSEGLLGCPLCHARYPIQHGAVDFTGGPSRVRSSRSDDPVDAMRLAAQLSLSEMGGIVLLAGGYAGVADQLVQLAGVTCVLVDAPLSSSPGAVNLEVADRLPLAEGVLKGAAVDKARAIEAFLTGIARCVRPLGRIVAPSQSTQPRGCRLIARDAQEWVVEVEEANSPVTLRRAQPA
jgi:uncharacterized protein YbaR (Trm112 family)